MRGGVEAKFGASGSLPLPASVAPLFVGLQRAGHIDIEGKPNTLSLRRHPCAAVQ